MYATATSRPPTNIGGQVSAAVDFEPYVVEDRELITGQNPRSDHPIAAKLIAALDRATVPA